MNRGKGGWMKELHALPAADRLDVTARLRRPGVAPAVNVVDLFKGNFKSREVLEAWEGLRTATLTPEMAREIQAALQRNRFLLLGLSERAYKMDDVLTLNGRAKRAGYPDMASGLSSGSPTDMSGKAGDRLLAASFGMEGDRLQVTTGFLRQMGGKNRADGFWDGNDFHSTSQMSPWLFWMDRGRGGLPD